MANDAAVAKAGRRTLRLSMDGIDYANTYLVGSFTHNGAFPIRLVVILEMDQFVSFEISLWY